MPLVVGEMNIKIHKESTWQVFFLNVILKKSNCCVNITGKCKKWEAGKLTSTNFLASRLDIIIHPQEGLTEINNLQI